MWSHNMSKIKVHILNFHSIWSSHIEILLENTSVTPHTTYTIDRWQSPKENWYFNQAPLSNADSVYSFDIEADPTKITQEWLKYYKETKKNESVFGENCSVAAQWFLTKFAGVPKPSMSNVSWNYLSVGIFWPSFIPCPVTLPGRIMSNAKFHINAHSNPELVNQYGNLLLYTSLSLAVMLFAGSVFGLAVAATILSGGIAAVAILAAAAVGIGSTYAFFKVHNQISAKNLYEKPSKKSMDSDEPKLDDSSKDDDILPDPSIP